MRFANSSRTLLLALSVVLATAVFAQDDHPNIQPNAVRNQLMGQTNSQPQPKGATPSQTPPPAQPKSAPVSQTPSPTPSKGAAPTGTNTAAKPAAPAKAPATAKAATAANGTTVANASPAPAASSKPAAKPAAASSPIKPGTEKPAEEKVSLVRRDPFDTLLNKARAGDAPPENLPPGKAGLIVSTLRIDGIVRSPNGAIAIVSNPQQRVYFLHEGDKLYDGNVAKIALDGVSFREFGKDAFGKPLEREVTKQLYASSGEQR